MTKELLLSKLVFSLTVLWCVSSAAAGEPDRNINGDSSNAESAKNQPAKVSRESILRISNRIDELVQAKLEDEEQQRNQTSSDSVFLRRIYLDIIGRIPTLEETQTFLDSKSSTKRADLIDDLQNSYGYTSRQYNYWADLLRVKSRVAGGITGASYVEFVKDSLAQNKPYDQFVSELLTADGANLERGNGAVGYYLRDQNMPEDNMSNTVRVFLGTRLECAQCHDHPFDDWSQRQYFEMVAFTGGIRFRNEDKSLRMVRNLIRKEDVPEKLRPQMNRIVRSITYGVSGGGTGLARLPEDFLGDEGSPNEVIVAREMFDGKALTQAKIPAPPKRKKNNRKKRPNRQQANIVGSKDIDSRQIYADWMTSPENPRFAKVIANRLWKQAMGLGLIEPVDIIESGTEASNPQLMQFLTDTMIELDFDMKQFLRAIYMTQTYQAEAFGSDVSDPQEYCFNGPIVRRMSAEQIWDSLLTLTLSDIDVRKPSLDPYGRYGDPYEQFEKLSSGSPKEIVATAKELAEKMSQKGKKRKAYKDDPRVKALAAQRQQIQKQLRTARKQRNDKAVRQLMTKQAQLVSEFRKKIGGNNFMRASELQSPAPASHFLREFGQSDREVIDNSNREPSVPQILSMMNGHIEKSICRDQSSVLMQSAIQCRTSKQCIQTVYLSMLNRKPTGQEISMWRRDFDAAVKKRDQRKILESFSDLIWTLANSNEFIFQK
jgi:hypothetical protein